MSPPEAPRAERAVPVFAALGDPTRIELVRRLSEGHARSISELHEGLGITRQATTKHLRVLESAGLVRSNRVGRENRFELAPDALDEAGAYLEHVSGQWDAAMERLRRYVED